MASDKIQLTAKAKYELRQLDPSEQIRLAGVLDMLENDELRDAGKKDYYDTNDFGEEVFGFVEDGFSLAFTENAIGQVIVFHLTRYSRFRPILRE